MAGQFRNGLFDCFGSMSDCLIGYCCPCIEAGMATKNAGLGTGCAALQCLFYPLLMPLLRNQVREQRSIDGSVIGDVAAGWCCPCCLAIQIKREFD